MSEQQIIEQTNEQTQQTSQEDILWKKIKPYVIGSTIALVIVVCLILVVWHIRQQNEQNAIALYLSGETSETWERILTQYPNTSITANALLRLAADQKQNNQLVEAANTYQTFSRKFPRHPASPAAKIAQAKCLEAAQKFSEAKQVYLHLLKKQNFMFAGEAALGLARIQIRENKPQEALQTLKTSLSQTPYASPTQMEIEAMISEIESNPVASK